MGRMTLPGMLKAPGNTYCSITSGNLMCVNLWRHLSGSPSIARRFLSDFEEGVSVRDAVWKVMQSAAGPEAAFPLLPGLFGEASALPGRWAFHSTCWHNSGGIILLHKTVTSEAEVRATKGSKSSQSRMWRMDVAFPHQGVSSIIFEVYS